MSKKTKNTKENRPPIIAQQILSILVREDERSSILNDFSEIFQELASKNGKAKARRWYWMQVVKSIPMLFKNLTFWRAAMFKNYLKIAIRNSLRNKGYSFIIIIGFSIGLACFIMMAMWVANELSYDKFFSKADRIYKVDADTHFSNKDLKLGSQTNYTGPMLKKDLPEIEKQLRIYQAFKSSTVKYGQDKIFREDKLIYADKEFFEFFDFHLKQGQIDLALVNPSSVVISMAMATKYFQNQNPLGKILEIDGKVVKVTGVVDINNLNSHINFDFLLPLPPFSFKAQEFQNLNLAYLTYILLKPNSDVDFLQRKATKLVNQYIKPVTKAIGMHKYRYDIILRPLKDVYLHSNIETFKTLRSGSITNTYIIIAVAFIILFIVSFNYMNLTLAKSLVRTKEMGLRRVVGAKRRQIHWQILGETLFHTVIACGVALLIVLIIFPIFRDLTRRNISIMTISPVSVGLMVVIIGTFVVISGFYPAMFLSKIKPVELVRSKFFSGRSKPLFRKLIIVTQFSLSIFLIISTLFIAKQIDFMKNRDLGFDKEDRIVLDLSASQYEKRHSLLRTAISGIPEVERVSLSSTIPGKFAGQNPFNIKGDLSIEFLWMYFVDYEFLHTFGLDLIKGRNFSKDITSDINESAIINESTVKKFGLKIPIGTVIQDQSDKKFYTVIGVIKDFHNESLHGEIKPLIIRSIYNDKQEAYMRPKFMTIQFKTQHTLKGITAIKEKYKQLIPHQLFEYFFIEELYNSFYNDDRQFNRIFYYASGLAIFLSCLGLFGLSAFIVRRKTKEIGLRKILGASVSKIFFLISKKMLMWVILANIVAWPVSYYAISQWLQNYAYRISIEIWIFIIAGMLALVIALLTVSFESLKAATANPVDSLRHE
jgi:putative ABC transport system permease protein